MVYACVWNWVHGGQMRTSSVLGCHFLPHSLERDLHWTRARLVTSQPERSSVPTALSVWICSHWWLLCGAGNQNSCLQDQCFYSLCYLPSPYFLDILISFSTTNHRDTDISILISTHVVFSFLEEPPQCKHMSPARALVIVSHSNPGRRWSNWHSYFSSILFHFTN